MSDKKVDEEWKKQAREEKEQLAKEGDRPPADVDRKGGGAGPDVAAARRERLRQHPDASLPGVEERRVVSEPPHGTSQSAPQHVVELRTRDRPRDPAALDLVQVDAPQFAVVGNHEMLRYARPQAMINPLHQIRTFPSVASRGKPSPYSARPALAKPL